MIVLINWLMYSGYFGLILGSYLLYLFLLDYVIDTILHDSYFIIGHLHFLILADLD